MPTRATVTGTPVATLVSMSATADEAGAGVATFESGALRAALQKQQNELAPIARVLDAAAAYPPQFSPDDWRGEAAESCLRLQHEVQLALLASDRALAAALRSTQTALAELGI